MSRILVVAGGKWQVPIVKKAKEMGHYVICSNLYENSPAFKYADVGVVVDVLDKEKNLSIAKRYNIDAVITDQSDIAVPTVAFVAEKLSLKGIGVETAARFTNKYKMREAVSKSLLLNMKFKYCITKADAIDFFNEYGKSIIKPLDSQSSRGVHIINSLNDLENSFDDSIQYSNNDKAIIIEQYIDGVEFTVDGIKTNKEYITLAISEKEHYSYNSSIANKLLFSKYNNSYDYKRLAEVNQRIVEILDLPFGLTHAEYKYYNGDFNLIEIAARGGGTRISSDIVPIMSGIDSNELLIDIVTGVDVNIKKKKSYDFAMLGFFDFKPGRIVDITGIKEVRKINGVVDAELEVEVGQYLNNAKDDRSRCGYYIIYANTYKELQSLETNVKDIVKVRTE